MYKLKWMRLAPTMCGSLLTTSKSSHLKGILTLKYCFLHCHTDYRCQHVTCSWYPRAFAATPSVNGVCTELCRPVYRTARLSLSVLHFWDSVYPIVQQLGQQFKQLIQKISKKSFCISKRKWQVCQDGQFWYPVFRLVSLGSVIWTLCTHRKTSGTVAKHRFPLQILSIQQHHFRRNQITLSELQGTKKP